MRLTSSVAVIAAFTVALGCHRSDKVSSSGGETTDSAGTTAKSDSGGGDEGATPVTMGAVTPRTIDIVVTGPGVTDAVEDERVRAPFNGLLTALRVNLGDRVSQGEVIGSVVAENSEAALQGAHAMLSGARTPSELADAQRALVVAERNIVRAPLRVDHSGVVIARPATPGERVTEGDSIISVAATGSMVFFADVAQKDLPRVQGGQRVRIELVARPGWLGGVVRTVLPSDTGSSATMRVRIDFVPASVPVTVGLTGTAHIVVAEHVNTPAVPRAALIRDDVTGVTQVAFVTATDRARWFTVVPGVADSAGVELLSPRMREGQVVITTGQVGLPDSARVTRKEANRATAP